MSASHQGTLMSSSLQSGRSGASTFVLPTGDGNVDVYGGEGSSYAGEAVAAARADNNLVAMTRGGRGMRIEDGDGLADNDLSNSVDSEEEKEEIDDEAKVAMKSYFAFI
jgi:hypothetical protein